VGREKKGDLQLFGDEGRRSRMWSQTLQNPTPPIRASLKMISRRKGVDVLLLTDGPAGLGGRDLNLGPGGERSADLSTVTGLRPPGSDNREGCASREHWSDSESKLEGSEGSVHQVDSAGADRISDDLGWYRS